MKKFYLFLFILFFLMETIGINFVEADSISLKDFSFYCEHDVKEVGYQDLLGVYKYIFSDGTKLDVSDMSYLNPFVIFLIDGFKYETNINSINENNITLVPVVKLSDILDWKLEWVKENDDFIINSINSKIRLKVNSDIASVNGEKFKMETSPVIIHDLVYIPLRFVCEKMGLEIKYYNHSEIDLFKHSSIITIDSKLDIPYISQEEAYRYLKSNLDNAFNAFEQNFKMLYDPDETLLKDVSSSLRENINNLKFTKDFSRYYVFKGPYTIYLDKYTSDVYFNIIDVSFSEVKKIKFDDPKLFEYNYMVN